MCAWKVHLALPTQAAETAPPDDDDAEIAEAGGDAVDSAGAAMTD